MTVSRAALTALALVLAPTAGRAQGTSTHIAMCGTDAFAQHFLEQVRYLLAGDDSTARDRRQAHALEPVPATEAVLVTDDQICIGAAAAYALETGPAHTPPAPFPVAVVRAGPRYLVQPAADTLDPAPRWPVLVLDLALRRRGAFPSGT